MRQTDIVNNDRNHIVDIMKGIGILLVIAGHYLPFGQTIIYSVHMPLFVLLSGYYFKPNTVKELMRKKTRSLLFPYLLTAVMVILVHLLIDGDIRMTLHRMISLFYALASDATLHKPSFVIKVGAIWFLPALLVGQLMMNFVIRIQNFVLQMTCVVGLLLSACICSKYICIPFSLGYGAAFLFYIYLAYAWKNRYLEKNAAFFHSKSVF